MNTNKIRIVAAVVDTHNLTLYKEDGSTIIIKQGEPRLRRIVNDAAPQLIEKGWAEVTIKEDIENSYADFEKEGSGAVKFFRIAKSKLKDIFTAKAAEVVDTTPVPVMSIGPVPTPAQQVFAETYRVVVDDNGKVSGTYDAASTTPEEKTPREAMEEQAKLLTDAGFPTVIKPEEEPLPTLEAFDDQNPAHWPVTQSPDEPEPIIQSAEVTKTMNVIDEIMMHAVPVQHENFDESSVAKQGNVVESTGHTKNMTDHGDDAPDTIIAVVDNKVIPGMERIKTQFGRAAKLGSTQGVERFLQRLAAVIDKRSHSIDDLLRFMERGDLPIADDGSILIYKVLNRQQNKEEFKDCHSGKVTQFVGAFVCMDESLIDPERRHECSTGLHVARRGYVRNFYGNACVLAKLAPEDVIAVPHGEANKMRVSGYHIIAELSERQYQLIKQNRPITDDEDGKKLLGRALAGDHVRRTHECRVTGAMGGGVTITPIPEDIPVVVEAVSPSVQDEDDEEENHILYPVASARAPVIPEAVALSNPETEKKVAPTPPLEVVKQVEVVTEQVQLTRKEQAEILYAACAGGGQEALDALHAFKKASKVSWEKLGLPDLNGSTFSIREVVAKPVKVKASRKDRKAQTKKGKAMKTKTPKLFEKEPSPPPKLFEPTEVESVQISEGSPRERIAKLLAIGVDSTGIAQQILDIKKKSKKSWEVLGVSERDVNQILNRTLQPK